MNECMNNSPGADDVSLHELQECMVAVVGLVLSVMDTCDFCGRGMIIGRVLVIHKTGHIKPVGFCRQCGDRMMVKNLINRR